MRNYIFLFYALIIIFLLCFSVNTNYIEGDDASTILYHLTGRDTGLQKPYAMYNSGFDFVLSFIDNQTEYKLRNFAYYISFFFSISILFLFIFLLKIIVEIKNEKLNYSFFFFLPLMMPEILFSSLVINSSNISNFFAILSLIFYLKSIKNQQVEKKYFIISLICFAIALPFRWSIIMFLPLFSSFHYLLKNDTFFKIIKINFFYILVSLILGFLLIYATGYNLSDFFEAIIWGKKYSNKSQNSLEQLFAIGSAFLTPIVVVLLFIGIVVNLKSKKNFLKTMLFLIFPSIPFFILNFYPSYKHAFQIIPLIIFFLYFGYTEMYLLFKKTTIFLVSIGIASIWLIGIELKYNNYAYGKSFEYKNPKELLNSYNNINKTKKINLNFNGGTFIPTPEGGRPIYGYSYVFLYQWKNLISNQQLVLDSIVKYLDKNNDTSIIQDRKTCFLQCTLFKYGYKTQMPFKSLDDKFLYRDFFNDEKKIRLFVIKDGVSRVQVSNDFLSSNKKIIFRSSYPSLIREVYRKNNNGKYFWDIYTMSNF